MPINGGTGIGSKARSGTGAKRKPALLDEHGEDSPFDSGSGLP